LNFFFGAKFLMKTEIHERLLLLSNF
jgi:hypothetical protein